MGLQTTLCYIEKDEKYLMLHRIKKKNDENKDKWIGVGGKFLEGESPEDCLLREVKEETGLTLTDYSYRGLVTFVYDAETYFCEYMHLFTAKGFEGQLTECDEGVLEWLPKQKIYDLPIWTGDKLFFDLLESSAPFFSLKLTYHKEKLYEAVLNGKKLPESSLDTGKIPCDFIR